MAQNDQQTKKNTEIWKQKQIEKKKKKQEADKLEYKQDHKNNQEFQRKSEKKKEEKQKVKKQKKEEKKKKQHKEDKYKLEEHEELVYKQSQQTQMGFKNLECVDSLLIGKHPQLRHNRSYQLDLIFKYMEKMLNRNDSILHLPSTPPKQNWEPDCLQLQLPDYHKNPKAELVCRYVDAGYFMPKLSKVIIQGAYAFRNGSFLAKLGHLNLLLMARHYKVPTVIYCPTWKYNDLTVLSECQLKDTFGKAAACYDWIEAGDIDLVVTEVGVCLPSQLAGHVRSTYKKYHYDQLQW